MKLIIPKFWHHKSFLSLLLLPLSYLYIFLTSLVRKKCIYIPKAKVISVGNITMGGAGKTPVALSIAKLMSQHKIVILTRGYKGLINGPLMVNEEHDITEIGDEALLLANYVPTCVSKDRLKGIKFLEELGYDLIITDDGMQDNRFFKSLSILVVDSYFGFGNGLVFPAGPLRERIESGINKTDFIAVIGGGDFIPPTTKPIKYAELKSKQKLENHKFIAFAGIGNPNKFFLTIKQYGGKIIKEIAFGDHHQYTERELDDLVNMAKKYNAKLITTEKDYVRISMKYKKKIEVLLVELVWDNENELQKMLLKL
jgi:tetraacyldisaccharide 4'-kinase